jgi:hypothetical protein
LAFTDHGFAVLTIFADGSGCQEVGLGTLGERMAMGQHTFWQALANVLGVTEAALWTPDLTPPPNTPHVR